ncbi:TBC1 domain family member 22B-like isoform X1 [Clavelina lepadiformis]|uniref:TBC1 domain family member 22B-like isoform X1 n=1 Tax=Clavelina lepadiformis TaxID=159417 RepID=UPI004041A483
MSSRYADDGKKKPFWKRSSRSASGSPSSNLQKKVASESPQHAPRHKLTFKEFENHTEDAWDAADDDLLRTAALTNMDMGFSPDQVQATAQAVIEQHAQSQSASQTTFFPDPPTTSGGALYVVSPSTDKNKYTNPTFTVKTFQPRRKYPGTATRTLPDSSSDSELNTRTETSKQQIERSNSQTADSLKNVSVDNDPPSVKENSNIDENAGVNGKSNTENSSRIILLPPSIASAGSAPKPQSIRMPMSAGNITKEKSRVEKFHQVINSTSTDLDELRKLSWPGIPSCVRAVTWQLLSGYLPANKDRRQIVLTRKRSEYFNFVDQYYEAREQPMYQTTFRQIHIDIPRTNPLIPLFQQSIVQNIFERLLFVWAVRHPASGYVQGINDLVTPFFIVFLTAQIDEGCDVETYDVSALPESILKEMEADTYWCVGNLLDGIQDNYTFAQPGVQNKVNKLRELTKRVDAELHAHLEAEQIEYLQFAFRWMNNLLMREIPLRCTIRLWDTYLAETDGFSDFHLYTCAAFLKQWRNQLLSEKDFQGLMLMIQNVPTHHWGDEEIKLLLAEAFRLKYMFADAPSHLPSKVSPAF